MHDPLNGVPDFFRYDALFRAIDWTGIAAIQKINHLDIVPVAESFLANVHRIDSMILHTPTMLRTAIVTERATLTVNLEVCGQPIITVDEIQSRGLTDKWNHAYDEEFARQRAIAAADPNDDARQLTQGLLMFRRYVAFADPDSHVHVGVEAILSTIIVDAWTAVETLMGDLWVAAVNTPPKGLANLGGYAKRIIDKADENRRKAMGKQPRNPNAGPKQQNMPLHEKTGSKEVALGELSRVSRDTFDLSSSMGKLLRESEVVGFARLESVRKAYAWAFNEHTFSIDEALSDTSLDALSSVRNLLIHHNGVADAEYADRLATVPGIPQLNPKQRLELDGPFVADLVQPAIRCCANLLTSVNAWIKMF